MTNLGNRPILEPITMAETLLLEMRVGHFFSKHFGYMKAEGVLLIREGEVGSREPKLANICDKSLINIV